MGVQEEDKCRKKGGEIQSLVGSKRLFQVPRIDFGGLEEEIYMKQHEGFAVNGKKELISKLKKFLYGLKQSPRMWYQKFDTFIWGLGFTRSKANHCVYFKLIGDRVIYLVLYVDDILLVGNDK